jgi:hypothetical protein
MPADEVNRMIERFCEAATLQLQLQTHFATKIVKCNKVACITRRLQKSGYSTIEQDETITLYDRMAMMKKWKPKIWDYATSMGLKWIIASYEHR